LCCIDYASFLQAIFLSVQFISFSFFSVCFKTDLFVSVVSKRV
jgi:hypothetical protein